MPEPRVFLYDEFTPEDTAMLQALYSRSAASAKEHVDRVRATGSGKFMETYYVGYSHKSIGDCGTTTLFFEGVSELAAKAIQDWQLYNGQQTSTRYIDFTKQPLIDPIGTDRSAAVQENWMRFYRESLQPVTEHLKKQFPLKDGEKESIYEKAIKARAFDILRSFLPAGVTTQLSWHTNLRQAWDKISWLRHHPLAELRDLAAKAETALKTQYPNSFNYKLYDSQEEYRRKCAAEYTYFNPAEHPDFACSTNINAEETEPYAALLRDRPVKTELPPFLDELGTVRFEYLLDYGSFRDVQRHRHGVCRMPLVTPDFGFEPWYLEQLPESLQEPACQLLADQEKSVTALDTSPEIAQYYLAMGYRVACRTTYPLPAAVYTAELRSSSTVHPSLRRVAHRMCDALEQTFPDLTLHCDRSEGAFDIRRGEQDIVKKEN